MDHELTSNQLGSAFRCADSERTPVYYVISSHPSSRTNEVGTTATFGVEAAAVENYQWLLNGTNLTNGGNVSGADTAALALTNVQTNDAGSYAVVVTEFLLGLSHQFHRPPHYHSSAPTDCLAGGVGYACLDMDNRRQMHGWIGQTNVTARWHRCSAESDHSG